MKKKQVIVVILLIILVGGVSFGVYRQISNIRAKESRINKLEEKAGFDLYNIEQPPSGFMYTDDDAYIDSGIVLMTVTSEQDNTKQINISQQKKPDLPYEEIFRGRELGNPGSKPEGSPVRFGILYDNQSKSGFSGTIVTDSSWITITLPDGIDRSMLSSLIENMEPVEL